MGYGDGSDEFYLSYSIKFLAPEKARGTLKIPEYKKKYRQADELAVQADAEFAEKKADIKATEKKTVKLAENNSFCKKSGRISEADQEIPQET